MRKINLENVTSFLKRYRKELDGVISIKTYSQNTEDFLTTSLNPSIQGTMIDILASWYSNGVVIDKRKMLTKLLPEDKIEIFLSYVNKQPLYKKAYLEAILTSFFRSGYPPNLKDFIDFEILKKDNLILDAISKRIKNRLSFGKNIVDNPSFFSYDYSLKGDGDIIVDGVLIDIKSTKNPRFTKDQVKQLFLYWFLNEESKKIDDIFTYKINSLEIFNPLYNISYKFNIENLGIKLDWLYSLKKTIK